MKSAVLLAGLHAEGHDLGHRAGADARPHRAGARRVRRRRSARRGTPSLSPAASGAIGQTLSVPGDFSSAAFWMVAAAALPGSRVEIDDVGLNPTRTGLIDVLRRFGARVEVSETGSRPASRAARSWSTGDRTGAVEIAPEEVPGLIDELPAIAALAAHGGEVSVRGAAELRVKESDRIAALVAGFRALGIAADERPDGFVVRAARRARPAASPTRAAITAWRWRSRSRRWPHGRRRHRGRRRRGHLLSRASSRRSDRLVA